MITTTLFISMSLMLLHQTIEGQIESLLCYFIVFHPKSGVY